MKMVSALALAIAALSAAAPAEAQKNKKQEQPVLKVSEEFRKPAAAVEAAITAKDWATAETQVAVLEPLAKTDVERYFAATYRLQVEANRDRPDGVVNAVNVLLANPNTPAAQLGYYNYLGGLAAFQAKKNAQALPFLLKARELGRTDSDIPFMLAQIYAASGNNAQGVAEMLKAIDATKAAGQQPKEAWYSWVVAKTYATGDRTATAQLLMRQIKEFPTLANWRKVIILYRDSANASGVQLEKRQRLDLFRLMRVSGALADEGDYFDYSKSSLDSGLGWEAVSVIDEGRKNGKIPAGKSDFAEVYTLAQNAVRAEGSLDGQATAAAKSASGKAASATGDAFLASANYARALEMYDLALQKGGVDVPAVNLHRGVALVQLGRKDEARTAFAAVNVAPLSDIAHFWVVWLDLPPLN